MRINFYAKLSMFAIVAICSAVLGGCPYQVPVINGGFDYTTTGWNQEQGAAMKVLGCTDTTATQKIYGCEGSYALFPTGDKTKTPSIVSQTVVLGQDKDIQTAIDAGKGNLQVSMKLAAAVIWDSSSSIPACKQDNPAFASDTVKMVATFLDAADAPLGTLATGEFECTGRESATKPTSGRVTYIFYRSYLDLTGGPDKGTEYLEGAVPALTRKIKFQIIGKNVTTADNATVGADSIAAFINFSPLP